MIDGYSTNTKTETKEMVLKAPFATSCNTVKCYSLPIRDEANLQC